MPSVLLALTLQAQAQSPGAAALPLPPGVQAALQRAGLPAEALAAMAVAPAGLAWSHQGDVAMPPASTMKLVTSVVALDRLGPNHRGGTQLLSAAAQVGDVLAGDLVLRGGADPDLGLPQMAALLAELRYQGIREIAGDIRLDRTLFRPPRLDLGLPPFDSEPEFPYNVIPDALHLAGSLMALELSADLSAMRVRSLPYLPGIAFDASAMVLNDKACKDWDEDWRTPQVTQRDGAWLVALRGAFPRGCTQRVELQLIDRQALAERQLRLLWQGLGGAWGGRAVEAAVPPQARLLASRSARPWGEVLRSMNKRSDNALTRLLYLSLGAAAQAADLAADPSTLQAAHAEVRAWFRRQGIDADGLVMDNGSGLSRSERISARQMTALLVAAQAAVYAPDLLMSLPLAGVDGGLRNRLTTGVANGRARLKPGTLRDVVALAGYVPDAQGRVWAVAAMINHPQAKLGRPVLDAWIEWVAGGGAAAPAMVPP